MFQTDDEPMAEMPVKVESAYNHALGMLKSMRASRDQIEKSSFPQLTFGQCGYDSSGELLAKLLDNADQKDLAEVVKHLVRQQRDTTFNREYTSNRLAILEETVRHLHTLAIKEEEKPDAPTD